MDAVRRRVPGALATGLVAGLIVGLTIGPVGAHVNKKVGHIFKHVQEKTTRTQATESVAASAEERKSGTAPCPRGQKDVGGGVGITSPGLFDPAPAQVALRTSSPTADETGWFGSAGATSATSEEWGLRVYAICDNL